MLHRRPIALPKSLLAVRAQQKIGSVEELDRAFTAFKNKYDNRHDKIEAALESMNLQAALGGGFSAGNPDPEYSKNFESYFRKGAAAAEANLSTANATGRRSEIQAAMSVGDNASGGYLAPTEWDR